MTTFAVPPSSMSETRTSPERWLYDLNTEALEVCIEQALMAWPTCSDSWERQWEDSVVTAVRKRVSGAVSNDFILQWWKDIRIWQDSPELIEYVIYHRAARVNDASSDPEDWYILSYSVSSSARLVLARVPYGNEAVPLQKLIQGNGM